MTGGTTAHNTAAHDVNNPQTGLVFYVRVIARFRGRNKLKCPRGRR